MILFTADWHIKLGQKNVPKDWAINRYRMFFSQLADIEEKVDHQAPQRCTRFQIVETDRAPAGSPRDQLVSEM